MFSKNSKGKILGDVSQYSIVRRSFSEDIFDRADNLELKNLATEEDMKNYFNNFVKDDEANKQKDQQQFNK